MYLLSKSCNSFNITTKVNRSNVFNFVPPTPSWLEPNCFCSSNDTLLGNIHDGIFDTSAKAYITKLVVVSENLCATNVMVQRNYGSLKPIIKKRKEIVQKKLVSLKDQILIITEERYQKLKAAEEARRK